MSFEAADRGMKHILVTSHWGCLLATRLISDDAKALISWLKQGLSGFPTLPSLPRTLHTLTVWKPVIRKSSQVWEDLGASPVWENKFFGFFRTDVSLLSHLCAHSIICLYQWGIVDIYYVLWVKSKNTWVNSLLKLFHLGPLDFFAVGAWVPLTGHRFCSLSTESF